MKPLLPMWRALLRGYLFITITVSLVVILVVVLTPTTRLIIEYGISLEFVTRPLAYAVLALVAGYGLFRGWHFHPVFDAPYCAWLANSPWTPERPLPKGPLHLVWFDFVVVGALSAVVCLLALTTTGPFWLFAAAPWALFVLALAFSWSFANATCGHFWYVCATLAVPVLFGIAGVALEGFLLCPIVMAAIAWLGVKRSLATFPWIKEDPGRERRRALSIVGWPYRHLHRDVVEFRTTTGWAALQALFAAGLWYVVGLASTSENPGDYPSAGAFFLGLATAVAAGVRLYSYAPAICDQLCWGRRRANKQWLIRRHDEIFLAPLLMIALGVGLPPLLYYGLAAPVGAALAIPAGLVVLVWRTMGPSVRELQYTGVYSKFGRRRPSDDFITVGSKS